MPPYHDGNVADIWNTFVPRVHGIDRRRRPEGTRSGYDERFREFIQTKGNARFVAAFGNLNGKCPDRQYFSLRASFGNAIEFLLRKSDSEIRIIRSQFQIYCMIEVVHSVMEGRVDERDAEMRCSVVGQPGKGNRDDFARNGSRCMSKNLTTEKMVHFADMGRFCDKLDAACEYPKALCVARGDPAPSRVRFDSNQECVLGYRFAQCLEVSSHAAAEITHQLGMRGSGVRYRLQFPLTLCRVLVRLGVVSEGFVCRISIGWVLRVSARCQVRSPCVQVGTDHETPSGRMVSIEWLFYYQIMIKVNIADARAHLSRYRESVENAETVLVCRRNVPAAEFRPVPRRARPAPRSCRLIVVTPFDRRIVSQANPHGMTIVASDAEIARYPATVLR